MTSQGGDEEQRWWSLVPNDQFLDRCTDAHTEWMREVDSAYDYLDPAQREHCLNGANRSRWFHGQPARWPEEED